MPKLSRVERFDEALSSFNIASEKIERIKDELENWKNGMEGTNLENTNKYMELEDVVKSLDKAWNHIDKALYALDDVEIPGAFNKNGR